MCLLQDLCIVIQGPVVYASPPARINIPMPRSYVPCTANGKVPFAEINFSGFPVKDLGG